MKELSQFENPYSLKRVSVAQSFTDYNNRNTITSDTSTKVVKKEIDQYRETDYVRIFNKAKRLRSCDLIQTELIDNKQTTHDEPSLRRFAQKVATHDLVGGYNQNKHRSDMVNQNKLKLMRKAEKNTTQRKQEAFRTKMTPLQQIQTA